MKTVAFVPIKMQNERLPGKNVKELMDGHPLIQNILETLLSVNEIDERYVYCSDPQIQKYLPDGIRFLQRNQYLDLQTTSFNEVLLSFSNDIGADIYILAHATAPFISCESIKKGIAAVKSGKHDSALAVERIQEFLWKDGRPINYDPAYIPRTQDLQPYYKETCGLYIYTSDLMKQRHRRVGDKPYLIEVSKIEACDINDADDFMIAKAMAKLMVKAEEA